MCTEGGELNGDEVIIEDDEGDEEEEAFELEPGVYSFSSSVSLKLTELFILVEDDFSIWEVD